MEVPKVQEATEIPGDQNGVTSAADSGQPPKEPAGANLNSLITPNKAGDNGGWQPFTRLAFAVTGRGGRWITLGVWVAAVAILMFAAPQLADYYDNNQTSSIGNQESVRADALLEKEFPQQKGLPAIIVFNNPQGLSQADYDRAGQVSQWLTSGQKPALVASVLSINTVPQAKPQLVSANGTTLEIIASLTGSPNEDAFDKGVKQIKDYLKQFDGKGSSLNIRLTGPAGITTDAIAVFSNTDLPLLLTTVGLVLVLLIIIYRSPILAILPLVAVGVVASVVTAVLGVAAKAGWFGVTQQASSVMTILLFGAGTDYTIFIVSRYREELQRESDRLMALRKALSRVNEAITSSAGTVIAALLTLILTTLALYNSLGPVLAIAIAFMLLGGLTLVPALLAILGRWAFWPFIPKVKSNERTARRGFWNWVGGIATSRPVATVWVSSLFLFVLGLGNLGVSDVYNFLTGFRQPTDSATGYKYLAANFPPGVLAPFDVVLDFKNNLNAYQQLSLIDGVQQAVAGVGAVDKVTGPTRPDGKQLLAPDLKTLQQQFGTLSPDLVKALRSGQGGEPGGTGANGGPDAQLIGLYAQTVSSISNDNSTVRLQVTLKSDPYGVPALDSIEPIRQAARAAITRAGLNESSVAVLLGGITPGLSDTRDVSNHDKLIVIPLVLLLTGLILGLLLRSVVAPLYLLLAVTLNFFAAVGASSFLFTVIQGDDGRAYTMPLYSFIFLVALGADYTIFLMSRVREEVADYGLVEGTRDALSHTGGVITSAGLILAGTFAVLATLPIRELYQLGITVAVGVVLDTLVVRGLLVPATVVLLRDANWWPGKLRAIRHQS